MARVPVEGAQVSDRKTALPLGPPIHLDEWCDGTHGPCACADQHNENHAWGHWRGGSVLSLRDVLVAFGERVRRECSRSVVAIGPAPLAATYDNAIDEAVDAVDAVDVARLLDSGD